MAARKLERLPSYVIRVTCSKTSHRSVHLGHFCVSVFLSDEVVFELSFSGYVFQFVVQLFYCFIVIACRSYALIMGGPAW